LKDITGLLKMLEIQNPNKIRLTVSEKWKYTFFKKFKKTLKEEKDVGKLIRKLVDEGHAKDISRIIPPFARNPSKMPVLIMDQDKEYKLLNEAKGFFEKEFGCSFEVVKAEENESLKARNAIPSRSAIEIE